MKITAVSDLHGYKPSLKGGDILIIAGDCTARDTLVEWGQFFHWMKAQDYTHKILIGGNHDNFLAQCCSTKESLELLPEEDQDGLDDFIYLCDSSVEVEGLKIHGSPWTLNFVSQNPKAMAFGLPAEYILSQKFNEITDDVDILVTHIPPHGILDSNYGLGSRALLKCVEEVKPRYHIFGHIHEDGQKSKTIDGTTYINAAICDEYYEERMSQMDFEI